MEPGSTPRPLVQKKTWRDSLPIDMLLSAASVLIVAQSSSEIPEGLINNPVYRALYLKTGAGFILMYCNITFCPCLLPLNSDLFLQPQKTGTTKLNSYCDKYLATST